MMLNYQTISSSTSKDSPGQSNEDLLQMIQETVNAAIKEHLQRRERERENTVGPVIGCHFLVLLGLAIEDVLGFHL